MRRTVIALLLLASAPAAAAPEVPIFESGQVRPLALSPDGRLLFAVNTPDARLEIFDVRRGELRHAASVQVGLEPVAVAARGDGEVWVVNHLSDSVSVVRVERRLGRQVARVERTLLVGDEPRDIVFAGAGRRRAFVTAAHRGQNAPFDPELLTPGVGRADVWVFDAADLGAAPGGTPLAIVNLFADTPRALAVTPDGATVYAAAFHSGNRTTILSEFVIPPELRLPPLTNHAGAPHPRTGMIVKHRERHWRDELGRVWDDLVMLSLPDLDVFAIDAMADPPAERAAFAGAGTVLYNLAVNPASGKVYVSNTEALNDVRFEGPGVFGGSTVRGHNTENRVTVIDPATGSVVPRHLNPHIDYGSCCAPVPNDENALSVALPTGMAVSGDGQRLYVAALGSSEVAVYDTAALESGSFVPSLADQIPLEGGGPTGLVLDEARGQLLVLTRFDNAVAVVDLVARREVARAPLYNPEPPSVTRGRRFLYDASFTSSRGDAACASCHVFGDMDSLAWDLGNPDGDLLANLNPLTASVFVEPLDPSFHPMKGPMTTQSLRGLANHGPMHWRGDRNGALEAPSVQPDSGAFDERAAFMKFNVAFPGLIGRHAPIPDEDMEAFTDFVLQVMYPPNPVRALDDSLTSDQEIGRANVFDIPRELGGQKCGDCHTLDPTANAEHGVAFPGFFGTDGRSSRTIVSQIVKVPHFRNLYQKVGMFGSILGPPVVLPIPGQNGFLGDQVRGFGYTHSGEADTILRFLAVPGFNDTPIVPNPFGFPPGEAGEALMRQVAEFLLAFDSNLKPIVGQQITVTPANLEATAARVALLKSRAAAGDCDLVAKVHLLGRERGFLYLGGDVWRTDDARWPTLREPDLHRFCLGERVAVTLTCVPPGSGMRFALDRDRDGVLDGNE